MADKNRYQAMIWVYKKRRVIAKKNKDAPSYRRMTKKISQWNNEIRRIEKREKKIKFLIKSINEYFDVRISSRKMNNEHKLARSIFYKIGMESGLRGIWLGKLIHRGPKMASLGRMSFTKSFQANKKNKEIFYRFKEHYEILCRSSK